MSTYYTPPGRRNTFHFEEGDRVRHSHYKGMVGTVTIKWPSGGLCITWDKLAASGSAGRTTLDCWDVEHVAPSE